MDELEFLKKDWQRKGEALPRLTFDEIYKMIWKKSSSIVKWIFYISILEFIFWTIGYRALAVLQDEGQIRQFHADNDLGRRFRRRALQQPIGRHLPVYGN